MPETNENNGRNYAKSAIFLGVGLIAAFLAFFGPAIVSLFTEPR